MYCRQNHAVAFNAAELDGLEVGHKQDFFAHQLLGLVVFGDAADDGALVGAVKNAELQELFGFFDLFARLDLADADVALGKIVNADLRHVRQLLADFLYLLAFAVVVLDDGVELLNFLFYVDSREERFALFDGHVKRQRAEFAGGFVGSALFAGADLLQRLGHGGGHKRREQRRHDANGVEQVVEHGGKADFVRLVLGEHPRGSFVDVFVGARNDLKNLNQRVLQLRFVNTVVHLGFERGDLGNQIRVKFAALAFNRQRAAEIFFRHRHGARHKVAKAVGEVGVDAVDHDLIGEGAVRAERHLAQDVIADRVRAVAFAQHKGIHHVAQRLGHLLTVKGDPAVHRQMLGERLLERHEHGRPDNRVKAHDVFGDHVHVGRPVFVVVVVGVVQIAQRGDIVRERVDPHIDDVLFVKGDGNAPLEGRARHAEVLQTGLDEVVDQLGSARFGAQIVGLGQQLFDSVRKGRHLEEIRLLLCLGDLSAALGALAVHELTLCPEALAGRAVFALVFALVDIAAVIELLEDFLHALDVIVVGGADIAVVFDVHKPPESLKNLRNLVHISLGRNALFGSLLLDF